MGAEIHGPGASPPPRSSADAAPTPSTTPPPATAPSPASSAPAHSTPADGMETTRPSAPGAPTTPPSAPTISRTDSTPTTGGPDLTAAQRSRVDALMRRLAPADQAALRRLLQSPAWADATARDDILTLVESLPASGNVQGSVRHSGAGSAGSPIESLVSLASPRAGETRPALLDRAADGATLAHHLAQAAQTPPDAEVMRAIVPQTRDQVVAELVREIADPGRINQGPNTCGATALQYTLISSNPAEYARLSAGLLHPGHVQMRDGNTLTRDDNSIAPSALSQRSPTERLFQGAIMEYASEGDYQTRTRTLDDGRVIEDDVQTGGFMSRIPLFLRILLDCLLIGLIGELVNAIVQAAGKDWSGLMPWEYEKAASSVFGQEQGYRLSFLGFPNAAHTQIDALRTMSANGDFHNRGVTVSMKWFGGHFLNVEQLDDSTTPPSLILRNPHGSYHGMHAGDAIPGMPAGVTVVDPNTGTVRVPLDDAHTGDITGIYYPESMAPQLTNTPADYNITI